MSVEKKERGQSAGVIERTGHHRMNGGAERRDLVGLAWIAEFVHAP